MKLVSNTLTGTNSALLRTEIMFYIASAKAIEADLIILYADESKFNTASRLLRSAKREGTIQLFVHSANLGERTTEVEYLKNKYPQISDIESSEPYFLLKV